MNVRLILGATIVLGFALRLIGLDAQSLWRDEMDTLVFAGRDLEPLFGAFILPGENAPLYFLSMKPWLALTGTTEFALRFPSALFGAAAVAPAYGLGSRLFNPPVAALAGLLVAANPFLVWYGQEARVYSLLVFVVALAALVLLIASERGGRWWVGAGLATLPLAGLHLLAPLFLAGNAALTLIVAGMRRWRPILVAHLPVLLVLIPAAVWQGRVMIDDVPSLYPDVNPALAAGRLATSYVSGVGQPVLWNGVAAALVLLTMLIQRGRGGSATVAWLALPVLLLLAVNSRFPLFLERYMLPVAVATSLLVASSIAVVARRRLLAGLMAALVVAPWIMVSLNPAISKPELRMLKQIIPDERPYVMVVAPWWQDTVGYYLNDATFITPPGAATTNREHAEELLPAILLGVDDLWLIWIDDPRWDPAGNIRIWLAATESGIRLRDGAFQVDRYSLAR